MGQTQSSDSGSSRVLENVFPIDPVQDRNLDKLSLVASRLLNTPDIYDINNLARPGVCGDYAVFLQKELTKRLLPYTIELKDAAGNKVRETVLYQSARAGADEETRKAVCSDMVGSMLRVVAIVLACLSSMQVASPSRPRTLKSQKGGGVPSLSEVANWMVANGFIRSTGSTIALNQQVPLLMNNPLESGVPAGTSFNVLFSEEKSRSVEGYFVTKEGSIRALFLSPITVTTGRTSILPIRLFDAAGATWAAGVLFKSQTGGLLFCSFVTGQQYPVTRFDYLLYLLFQKSKIGTTTVALPEKRETAIAAGQTFNDLMKVPETMKPQVDNLLYFLRSYIGGDYVAQQPPALPGFGAGMYPPQAAGIPAVYGAAPPPPPTYQAPGVYGAAPAGAAPYQARPPVAPYQPLPITPYQPQAAVTPGYYHIPLVATNNIMTIFKKYSKVIPLESSPAVVRAFALRGSMDSERRMFQPRVCDDDYWRKNDLSDITPWATFQFLCTQDWESLKDQNTVKMESEWDEFLSELQTIYNGDRCPTFVRPPGAKLLPQMKFSNISNTRLCEKAGETPYVGFRKVQDGVLRLQGLYAAHVKKMWAILNSLIQIIKDPQSKVEMVRLNDAVLKGPSSRAYVDQKAAEARRALLQYYKDVEQEYVKTIKAIGDDLPKPVA
jgi:hypothetical protein